MAEQSPATIRAGYRTAFLKGLAAILPTFLTIYILLATYAFVDNNIATPINRTIKTQLVATLAGRELAIRSLHLDPELLREGNEPELAKAVDQAYPSWIGFAAAVVVCLVVGFFIASIVGRRLWTAVEGWFHRIPIVRAIYPTAKQVTEFFIADDADTKRFSRVVIVPFPGEGQLSVAFVMAEGFRAVDERYGKRHLNVFVPMSPTPVTGFVVLVPEDQVLVVDMSVDEAFKYYLTCGLFVPERLVAQPRGSGAATAPIAP